MISFHDRGGIGVTRIISAMKRATFNDVKSDKIITHINYTYMN